MNSNSSSMSNTSPEEHKKIKGRPSDPIRKNFEELQNGSLRCINCSKIVSNRVATLRTHMAHCEGEKIQEDHANEDVIDINEGTKMNGKLNSLLLLLF